MAFFTRPMTSASNLVPLALATALFVFGIVMCAVADPPGSALSPETATSLSPPRFADCAASSRENGRPARRYGRMPRGPGRALPFEPKGCSGLSSHLAPWVELQGEHGYLVYQGDTPRD